MKLSITNLCSIKLPVVLLAAAVSVAACSCRATPVTGRRQLLLVPESQEVSQGLAAYHDVVSKEPPSRNREYVELVNRVGQRIADVAGRPDYEWEFRVIESPTQNAFCLPGGKVAVYEGIIPVCENEAGLAVVMSHEISHALARHGGERISHQQVAATVQRAVSYVVQDRSELQQKIVLAAYGGAAQYGAILPFSREHESEADYIGLLLAAQAGYDPREAVPVWERMEQVGGAQPPEFLSTHPSHGTRIADLQSWMAEALDLYAKAAPAPATPELPRQPVSQAVYMN